MRNGGRLWQLQQVCKIRLLHENGAFVEYLLALGLTPIDGYSGNWDPIVKFVQLRNAPAMRRLRVSIVGYIAGSMNLITEIPTSSETGVQRNKRWIIKCQLHLSTWNDV